MDQSIDEFTTLTNTQSDVPKHGLNTNTRLHSLLENAIVRRSVYVSAITRDLISLQKSLKYAAELNTDVALAAVDCVPNSWEKGNSLTTISDFVKGYIGLIGLSKSPEVCSVALSRLAKTIDEYFANAKLDLKPEHSSYDEVRAFKFDIAELQNSVHGRMETPSLSNARIRISGAIPLFKELTNYTTSQSGKPGRTFLEPWGELLATAGATNNVCDTRCFLVYC
jgi:hypothetical protein